MVSVLVCAEAFYKCGSGSITFVRVVARVSKWIPGASRTIYHSVQANRLSNQQKAEAIAREEKARAEYLEKQEDEKLMLALNLIWARAVPRGGTMKLNDPGFVERETMRKSVRASRNRAVRRKVVGWKVGEETPEEFIQTWKDRTRLTPRNNSAQEKREKKERERERRRLAQRSQHVMRRKMYMERRAAQKSLKIVTQAAREDRRRQRVMEGLDDSLSEYTEHSAASAETGFDVVGANTLQYLNALAKRTCKCIS